MISSEMAHRVKVAEDMALKNGRSLVDVLDDLGLLFTEDRRKKAQLLAIDQMIDQLEQQNHTALMNLGGGQSTVSDGINGAVEFCKLFRKVYE